jgi:hypothetical protein
MGFYLLENSPVNGTQWQQWGYPRRGSSLSGTVIMHTSESALDELGPDAGAEDCAKFIANRTGSYGSYHDLVDSDSIIEMVPFEYEAWQDSETNPWAVGISAACRTSDWLTMGDAKREGYYRNLAWCAADFVKYMRAVYNIEVPRVRITGAQARAKVPGFCAHGDSGIARTDPGVNFDWARFFKYTDEALAGIDYQGGVITPKDDDIMITLAKKEGGTEIWAGDGVVRRHIPNPQSLNDLIYLGKNGYLNVAKGGEIVTLKDLDAIGADIPDVLLNRGIPWYGYNGKIPTEGRQHTSLALQTGWADTQIVGLQDTIKANAGTVELTEEDIAKIVEALKVSVAPAIAAELAKRLAE